MDEIFIKRCIDLSRLSLENGDWPFGAVLVFENKIIAEATNTAKEEITGHAEVNVVRKILNERPNIDLSFCTLYSNFEPCPMCSFIIREHGIGRVVYALPSPFWGGKSRWPILCDLIPERAFADVKNANIPEVIGGVLEEEARKVFDELGWTMYQK